MCICLFRLLLRCIYQLYKIDLVPLTLTLYRRLCFSFPCNFSTKGQIQHVRKPKRHDIFFSILNYWFTCLSSVGSPPFSKIFTLGNNIGHIIECSRFSNYCRSNCFEWKSLMKHRHSTKSNSPKKSIIQFLKSIKLWVRLPNKVEQNQTF